MENLELVLQKLEELKSIMSDKIASDDKPQMAEAAGENESEIEHEEEVNPISEVTEEGVDNSSGDFESEEEMREYLRGPKKPEKKKNGMAVMLAIKGKK